MAADYQKKYGKPAADKAWMGWIAAKSLFESIDAAKSTETEAIIKGLESWKGGTASQPVLLAQGRPPDAAAEPGGAGEARRSPTSGTIST